MPSAKFIAGLSKTISEIKDEKKQNVSIHIGGNVEGNIVVGDRNKIQSNEESDRIANAKKEREAKEKAERERLEREAHEKEQGQQDEKLALAKKEREAKEKAERERLERETREKEQRQQAEKFALAKKEREAKEKIERERLERETREKERYQQPKKEALQWITIFSLLLGVINLAAWFLPICGIPLALAGITLGYLSMTEQSRKAIPIAGIVLNSLGLIAACINAAVGAYLAATGQGGFDFNF
jgi:cation transport ATPase